MMLMRIAHRARARIRVVLATCLALFFLLAVLLPYDSAVRLSARFNAHRLAAHLFGLGAGPPDAAALAALPAHPLDLVDDVGVLLKSGYGTQARIQPSLAALESGVGCRDVVVVADFDPAPLGLRYEYRGAEVPVRDILARVLLDDGLRWMAATPRFRKYADMVAAVAAGRADLAQELGRKVGWELDALKFIPGLDLTYELMPSKKWYLILDDDTYVIRPSLRLLLEHLDPDVPQYIGNPVGDFKGRFAHGGSAVILSRAAMHRLFRRNPRVVAQAYREALAETWGDKLVATTLIKVGVYLDEQYARFFNGEAPLITRIRPDRFCAPVVAFHGLADPEQMRNATALLKAVDEPVLWSDVWSLYGGPDLGADAAAEPVTRYADYVGRVDETMKVVKGIDEAEGCQERCASDATCLAWTWALDGGVCKLSPSMIVGTKGEGGFSGINAPRARELLSRCRKTA